MDCKFQTGEVITRTSVLVELQHSHKHGWNPLGMRHLVAFNQQLQGLFGVKVFHDDDGATGSENCHRKPDRGGMISGAR